MSCDVDEWLATKLFISSFLWWLELFYFEESFICKIIFFPPNFSFVFWKENFGGKKITLQRRYFAEKMLTFGRLKNSPSKPFHRNCFTTKKVLMIHWTGKFVAENPDNNKFVKKKIPSKSIFHFFFKFQLNEKSIKKLKKLSEIEKFLMASQSQIHTLFD